MKRLLLLAALLVACSPQEVPEVEKPPKEEPQKVGTADGALGVRLSLSGQAENWTPAKAADLYLAGQKVGQIDAAGRWQVEGEASPPRLLPVEQVFPQWLGMVDGLGPCSVRALSVSDSAAQVAAYEGLRLNAQTSMVPLLSPIPPAPALIRSRTEGREDWRTFLVYADRAVDLQGRLNCVVKGWNGSTNPPSWPQDSFLDLTLAKGWNVVTRHASYAADGQGGVTTRTWDGDATPALPWRYNGVPF